MRIAHYLPPIDTFGGRVRTWDPIRDDLFSGALAETLYTPHFVGTIEGEFAGSLGYYTPADTRDVGIVEFVATEDHHRRKGVADALMARMLADFLADGGQALHLCTTNPIAGRLYENHGFWYRVGDGMRYTAPGAEDFDAAYLAFDGEPVVRDRVGDGMRYSAKDAADLATRIGRIWPSMATPGAGGAGCRLGRSAWALPRASARCSTTHPDAGLGSRGPAPVLDVAGPTHPRLPRVGNLLHPERLSARHALRVPLRAPHASHSEAVADENAQLQGAVLAKRAMSRLADASQSPGNLPASVRLVGGWQPGPSCGDHFPSSARSLATARDEPDH